MQCIKISHLEKSSSICGLAIFEWHMLSDVESAKIGKYPQNFKNNYLKQPQKYGKLMTISFSETKEKTKIYSPL